MGKVLVTAASEIEYPDSDGEPMSENTLQFLWIQTIQGNLASLFKDRADVFVAGDNLIYPIEGDNETRRAPDVYVAFGRPKGHRGSYRVWEEDGIFPQVIFEILSPGNRAGDMQDRFAFYERFGAEEYYFFDPIQNTLDGFSRVESQLVEIEDINLFISPRTGIRFITSGPELVIQHPSGRRFQTFAEIDAERQEATRQAEREKQKAEREKQKAQEAEQRAAKLADRLRKLGIDPDEQ